MGRLEGKCILVTGAGRGLGLAVARMCVAEGAQVIAVARDAQNLAKAIEPLGPHAVAIAGDLGEPAEVERIFSDVARRFGKLDALINNAAIYDVFGIAEAEAERIRATLNSNLLAPILCIRAATPLMRKAGGGDIVNITSESVTAPLALLTVYAATKAGLETLSRGLRTELRPDHIRVTALRLGIMLHLNPTMADPATQQRFVAANAAALQMMAANGGMATDSVAQVLINILTLPADACFELVDLRPRG
jgi:NAD(P)-dependent dehydrogenase (short-subunit alcohol dehydrogenase family)